MYTLAVWGLLVLCLAAWHTTPHLVNVCEGRWVPCDAVPARITSVDVSIWPPSYVIKEDGAKTERDTEGGRIIAEVLSQAIAADEAMQAREGG